MCWAGPLCFQVDKGFRDEIRITSWSKSSQFSPGLKCTVISNGRTSARIRDCLQNVDSLFQKHVQLFYFLPELEIIV